MKRRDRPQPLDHTAGIWRQDAEKLEGQGVRTDVDLVSHVRSEGLDGLSERTGVPPGQLRRYLLIAQWEIFKRSLERKALVVSGVALTAFLVGSTVLARQNWPTEENELYTRYVEVYERGDAAEVDRAKATIDSILEEEIDFTAADPCAIVRNEPGKASPTTAVADLGILRGLFYLRDGSLNNAMRLNRRLDTNRSHRGYALNNLGNAYLRQAEIIDSLRSEPDIASPEIPDDRRAELRDFLCVSEGVEVGSAADSALRLAADSAELAYNVALRLAIDGGSDTERLRLAVQHNIFNLQARRRAWLDESDPREPDLGPIAESIRNLAARLDTIMTQASDTAAHDTLILLLQQVHVQEGEQAPDTVPGPSP